MGAYITPISIDWRSPSEEKCLTRVQFYQPIKKNKIMTFSNLHDSVLESIPVDSDGICYDGSYYLTDGKTVCTVDVDHCGVINAPKFDILRVWQDFYGDHCPKA